MSVGLLQIDPGEPDAAVQAVILDVLCGAVDEALVSAPATLLTSDLPVHPLDSRR